MKMTIFHFSSMALLTTALLMTPLVVGADEHKDERRYHDKRHNDDHAWNDREDQAYRMWARQRHRRYDDFSKLKDRDQRAYWGWRHQHSDALLKIEIH